MVEQPFGNELVAGDVWNWTITLCDYSPTLYTLKYFFRGPKTLDLVAVASGSGFQVTATAAQTSPLDPGVYFWQMCVFDASNNRTELVRGSVEVLADISAMGEGIEGRSWVKQALDAVRAVIQGRASRVESEYQINGRMLRLMSPQELLDHEGDLTNRYNDELRDSGQRKRKSNQVLVRFV
jgi:hypothetical protein